MEPAHIPADALALDAVGLSPDFDPSLVSDPAVLAGLSDRAGAIIASLRTLRSLLDSRLAEVMPSRIMDAGAWRIERNRTNDDEWDDDALARAVNTAIANQVSTDPATGEVDRAARRAAFEALARARLLFPLRGSGIRTSVMPTFGLNPSDYRTRTPSGYRVTITRVHHA